MRRALPLWIVLSGIATVAAIAGLVVVQQQLRGAANHPQVEMAREAAGNLNAGVNPQSVVNGAPVDIAEQVCGRGRMIAFWLHQLLSISPATQIGSQCSALDSAWRPDTN